MLGETDVDPSGNKADHILAVPAASTNTFHQLMSESDSDISGEVYMVGQGDPPLDKTVEEIEREAEEEMARVARLPGNWIKGRGITACSMTRGHQRMRLGMEFLQGGTT
jgi:hypothetical protein